jgi:hypothetical protein
LQEFKEIRAEIKPMPFAAKRFVEDLRYEEHGLQRIKEQMKRIEAAHTRALEQPIVQVARESLPQCVADLTLWLAHIAAFCITWAGCATMALYSPYLFDTWYRFLFFVMLVLGSWATMCFMDCIRTGLLTITEFSKLESRRWASHGEWSMANPERCANYITDEDMILRKKRITYYAMSSGAERTSSDTSEVSDSEAISRVRPTVGDIVSILQEDHPRITGTTGKRGKIIRDDGPSLWAYEIRFTNGETFWYKEDWIDWAMTPMRRAYLPVKLDGATVLVQEFPKFPNTWRVTTQDGHLRSSTAGLAYRKSKNLDDKVGKGVADWGSLVYGYDEGDGWIRLH